MKFLKLSMLALITVLAIALTGCGGESSSSSTDLGSPDDFVGVWEWTTSEGDADASVTTEEIAELKANGLTVKMIICADNTVVYDSMGDIDNGKWSTSNGTHINFEFPSGEMNGHLEDGVLKAFFSNGDETYALTNEVVPDTAADYVSSNPTS